MITSVTGNAQLLLGYIGGALSLTELAERDYRIVEIDADRGAQVFEHVRTGNRFRMTIEQIDGVE